MTDKIYPKSKIISIAGIYGRASNICALCADGSIWEGKVPVWGKEITEWKCIFQIPAPEKINNN